MMKTTDDGAGSGATGENTPVILTSQMKDQIMNILVSFAFKAVCTEAGRDAEAIAMQKINEMFNSQTKEQKP